MMKSDFPKNGKRKNSPFSKINGKRDFIGFPKLTENGKIPDVGKTRKTGLLKGTSCPLSKTPGVFEAERVQNDRN